MAGNGPLIMPPSLVANVKYEANAFYYQNIVPSTFITDVPGLLSHMRTAMDKKWHPPRSAFRAAICKEVERLIREKRNVPPELSLFIRHGVLGYAVVAAARTALAALSSTKPLEGVPAKLKKFESIGLGRPSVLACYSSWFGLVGCPDSAGMCFARVKEPASHSSTDQDFLSLLLPVIVDTPSIPDLYQIGHLAYVESLVPAAWLQYLIQTKGIPGRLFPLTVRSLQAQYQTVKDTRGNINALDPDLHKDLYTPVVPYAARLVLELTLQPLCTALKEIIKHTKRAETRGNRLRAINRDLATFGLDILEQLVANVRLGFAKLDEARPRTKEAFGRHSQRVSLLYCKLLNQSRELAYTTLYYLVELSAGMYAGTAEREGNTDREWRVGDLRAVILRNTGAVDAWAVRRYRETLGFPDLPWDIDSHEALGRAWVWLAGQANVDLQLRFTSGDFAAERELVKMLGTSEVGWEAVGFEKALY